MHDGDSAMSPVIGQFCQRLAIELSALPRFADSDYPFGIFGLFFIDYFDTFSIFQKSVLKQLCIKSLNYLPN
jgi:hypothetical protein